MLPVCRKWIAALGFASFLAFPGFAAAAPAPRDFSTDANRFTYLDADEPFYPGLHFPKLTTPQWVGEAGVEAVVILSIDDMSEPNKYERFLRPILERLKQIDGRAPVSILANSPPPTHPQLQPWLREGLSIDVHTLAHPCPCLAKGDLVAAANTYHGCVDLLNQIPGSRPVAFRMPCCDSMNSPSPRFYSEIFNRVSAEGRFLTIDSSVMNITTPKDASLPRDLVVDRDGRERFRKYLPTQTNQTTRVSMESFTTTIEDYPYPYVIGKLCWEFPAALPSDWEAFNLLGPTNATLLADWKAGLDVAVRKQGVFTVVFHPHGWSSSAQFVELIDYAVKTYGRKVRFLNFREAQERLDKHLLAGVPLRAPDGRDNGVRLLDLDNDGYQDVLIGSATRSATRIWNTARRSWNEAAGLPVKLNEASVRFGVVDSQGPVAIVRNPDGPAAFYRFVQDRWSGDTALANGLDLGASIGRGNAGPEDGLRLRDVDRDGACELIIGGEAAAGQTGGGSAASLNAIYSWSAKSNTWTKLPFTLPTGASLVDRQGRDNGVRFVDVNEDGYDDLLLSNEKEFALHLFVPKANPRLMWEVGWNDTAFRGKRGEAPFEIPRIVRDGANRNNGVWFARNTMWIQNEDTAHLADKVDRRTFKQLLNADQPQAMSPAESLKAMRVRPGFKVELVAAEPLVVDPIAFDWSADGRLWVVEMKDYPLGKNNDNKPGGRIKILEDEDGDGRYDKSTVFMDDLNFPAGLMAWRGGVLVAAAPEIFYAEDTDGDGKADKRETVFSGFTEGNPQHRLNGFDYGLDNWVYGANGDSGGKVRSHRRPDGKLVDINGRDFRFKPETGEFEAIEGQTQFGRHRDSWGNWFGNSNPVWLWHYHLPERYLARNPHLAVKKSLQMLADYPNSTRLFPASRTRQRFNDHHQFNHVTSANSPMPYCDELFGPEFATSVFISDPVHNLVHREVLEPNGVTFSSHRAKDEHDSEFLASADNWFRPIMLKTGPDGALYIADMYRQVLEHPEWIPVHIRPRLDLRAGQDKGRIYRVFPTEAKLRKVPKLDRLDTAGLVAALASVNGWERDTAQRLLIQRGDKSAVNLLEKLVAEHPHAKTRLQALWTLEGLGALTRQMLEKGWKDENAEVRANAIRAAEPFGDEIESRLTTVVGLPGLSQLVRDPSPRVRLQLAFSVGEWDGGSCGRLLRQLAVRDFGDPAMQMAILSSAPRHLENLVDGALTSAQSQLPEKLLEELLGLAVAMKKQDLIATALSTIATNRTTKGFEAWQFNSLAALLDAIERRGATFESFARDGGDRLREPLNRIEPLFAEAGTVSGDPAKSETLRRAAIRLQGRREAGRGAGFQQLGLLLAPENPTPIQQEALKALGRSRETAAAESVLAAWNGFGPAMREEALGTMFARTAWTRLLVDRIERDVIPARQIGAIWQQKLLKHQDASLRQRAAKVFSATQADRQALLREYAAVNQLKGDPQKGAAVFRQHCAVCHRLGGDGEAVGPDLGALSDKSVPALLTAILDPNQAVESRYVNYSATTRDDRELSGIISVEGANSVTLRTSDGREETLLRRDLKEFSSSGLSLMPEGFEKALNVQDMADLISVLTGR